MSLDALAMLALGIGRTLAAFHLDKLVRTRTTRKFLAEVFGET
jgi:hypothetical protein